jgi:lysyl-tRNA synthetase class 2
MNFRIDERVLERFPDLAIGVVVACGLDNRAGRESSAEFLREQVEHVQNAWSREQLDADPRIGAWRDAYRSFGAKPKKHRCSVENMLRTILDGGEIPSINPVVDVYNAISLKHAVPAGGDDLDRIVGDIVLTLASGDERFVPLNGTESVSPKPGEVIYRDDEDVLCRRWNWRECDKSKMTADSTNVALVVEGLLPVAADDIGRIAGELAEAIEAVCGGRTNVHLVHRGARSIAIGGTE